MKIEWKTWQEIEEKYPSAPVPARAMDVLASECNEAPLHEYDCPECLKRERARPDPFDVACERRFDEGATP